MLGIWKLVSALTSPLNLFFPPEDMRAKIVLGSNQLRGLTLSKARNSQNTNLHVQNFLHPNNRLVSVLKDILAPKSIKSAELRLLLGVCCKDILLIVQLDLSYRRHPRNEYISTYARHNSDRQGHRIQEDKHKQKLGRMSKHLSRLQQMYRQGCWIKYTIPSYI